MHLMKAFIGVEYTSQPHRCETQDKTKLPGVADSIHFVYILE